MSVAVTDKRRPFIPDVKAKLLEGKRGLIVGIANDQSIAWEVAPRRSALSAQN